MKLLTKRWIVYLLITMMAVPTMLFASIAGIKPAMASNFEQVYSVDLGSLEPNLAAWHASSKISGAKYSETSGAEAGWKFTPDVTGKYSVSTNWFASTDQTTDAIYSIVDATGTTSTYHVNQKLDINGSTPTPSGTVTDYKVFGSDFEFQKDAEYSVSLGGISNTSNHLFAGKIKVSHDNVLPIAPILVSPENNIVTSNNKPTFSWNGSAYDGDGDAINYTLHIVKGLVDDSHSHVTSPYTVIGHLDDGAYTWYVTARGTDVTAPYPQSEIRAFTIDDAILTAEDFGVVKYDVGSGLGTLSGYTAGFGLTNATFAEATSVVMKLYSGATEDTLLQTNTLNGPNAGLITGIQISSPFDVSGTFDYLADGYWTNHREGQYGQGVPATRIVATVTLASGAVLTAENTNLTGDPTTIYPAVPAIPDVTVTAGNGKSIDVAFKGVDSGVIQYQVYVNGILANTTPAVANDLGYAYLINIPVGSYGTYGVYVVAKNSSNGMSQSIPRSFALVAPASATVPARHTSVQSSFVAPTTAQAATTAPASTTPGLDEQGQIKAAETTSNTTESNKINWTPWIILFILILLAGAATGGYFYWFGGDSETAAATVVIKDKKVVATAPKDATNKPLPKSDKKSRRW